MKKFLILVLLIPTMLYTCASFGGEGSGMEEDSEAYLIIENTTPYEIHYLYTVTAGAEEDWGENLVEAEPLASQDSMEITVPPGRYKLVAELLVGDSYYMVEEEIGFGKGKSYMWQIDEDNLDSYEGKLGYGYMDDDSYGYMEGDSYGYMGGYDEDSYGYMEEEW